MENALIQEGFPPEQIQLLCDVHVSVFESALQSHKNPEQQPGHPLHTYQMENKELEKRCDQVERLLGKAETESETEKLGELLGQLREIDKHYLHKTSFFRGWNKKDLPGRPR
jgi:hypothetical protein